LTQRLVDISAHIDGIRQLGSVVNAMRGIAGARTQQAREGLLAVDGYAATIAAAIGEVSALLPEPGAASRRQKPAVLVVFAGEEGFAGNYSDRVLGLAAGETADDVFLVGSRGVEMAATHGLAPVWTAAMPGHPSGVPRLAEDIAAALYERIAAGSIDRITAVFASWQPGSGLLLRRQTLLPLDPASFAASGAGMTPLFNLPPARLLDQLVADYVHACLCQAALHAFAAENEARIEAMAAATREIDRQLDLLERQRRIVRQDEITAEIIELAAGEAAARSRRA